MESIFERDLKIYTAIEKSTNYLLEIIKASHKPQ